MKTAFDSNGKYTPFDINLPRSLPKRADGWQAFATDTPLTEIGYLEAKLTGYSSKMGSAKWDILRSSIQGQTHRPRPYLPFPGTEMCADGSGLH